MATIKAIEARSVHQIQSGQVIVDLCSVAKELVENSLDAGATSVEVRFKNNGLDLIEVQDNGAGISPENYETVALKHYTSKLSTYDDLSSLQTFGFRGEALSSLCALSLFTIVTAQADEAPKGKKLEFETSGKLKSTSVIASQRGTTVTVENLFESLPVRRRELAKNIKREYGKVLNLLHAYACISTNVKFTVKNTMPKAKSMTVFSTKGNATTRENIANVYGAKTLSALTMLDLELDFRPSAPQLGQTGAETTTIRVQGHISKPVFGEGRQTPDRQMFFVNGRPCALPQIAKAINEVYKSFNISQSPFIFADLQMDTNAYDVNVSPDKRTILLHDAATLIENLKSSLTDMFDQQDQTVPQAQLQTQRTQSLLQTRKQPAFQPLNVSRSSPAEPPGANSQQSSISTDESSTRDRSVSADVPAIDMEIFRNPLSLQQLRLKSSPREEQPSNTETGALEDNMEDQAEKNAPRHTERGQNEVNSDNGSDIEDDSILEKVESEHEVLTQNDPIKLQVKDFNQRMAQLQAKTGSPASDRQAEQMNKRPVVVLDSETPTADVDREARGVVPDAFDRMRPKRMAAELATITVGDHTITTIIGNQMPKVQDGAAHRRLVEINSRPQKSAKSSQTTLFSQRLRRKFGAPGSQVPGEEQREVDEDEDVQDDEDEDEEDVEMKEDLTNVADSSEAEDDNPSSTREGSASDSPNAVEEDAESDVPVVQRGSRFGDSEEIDQSQDGASEDDAESDGDYMDETEKRRVEEARVAELIRTAEESAAQPSKQNLKRAAKVLVHNQSKDSTTSLLTSIDFPVPSIIRELRLTHTAINNAGEGGQEQVQDEIIAGQDEETQLALTVSKADFAKMNVVGQFNLGFILAVRAAADSSSHDELFIIDQHASDEKYNFERLQAETVVGNQRLVRPVTLDLTAVEEEIVLESKEALEKNGFLVEVDTSGESMVGQRCRLVSLPLSKEVVFGTRDLDELIQLLAEGPGLGSSNDADIPRPSKVRKMFAMRACRSSIMIGKTLSKKQMEKVVVHMGEIDKPWNCPHGRPTMRHLSRLGGIRTWREGVDEAAVGMGDALRGYLAEEQRK